VALHTNFTRNKAFNRLDAALRIGLAQRSPEIRISAEEIHHFNKIGIEKWIGT
jgi:hypothetical protein